MRMESREFLCFPHKCFLSYLFPHPILPEESDAGSHHEKCDTEGDDKGAKDKKTVEHNEE